MAILPESTVEVVEDESHVSPPPGSVPATSISLTFFDIIYLVTIPVDCNWMQRLFFYESKHSAADFIGNILPGLKASLSLTLQRFFPFAGIVVFPPPPRMPYIVLAEGDSVLFVVKESSVDFDHLVGDHARDHDGFLSLVPRKPPAIERMSVDGCRQEPAMAVQVTVFPNAGFSIGVGFSHNVADGMTFAHFMKSWASIHRNRKAPDDHLPIFDRDSIDDPLGLAPLLMNNIGMTLQGTISPNSSFNNLRVTFKIKRSQIESLKTEVKTKCNELNGSTFVVACAYIWVCLTKLHRSSTHSDELSYFHFPADCRAHLNLPQTYFGNCLTLRLTSAKRSELLSENGFPVAAIAIEREITEFRKQPFKDATKSLLKTIEKNKTEKDIVLLVSSPKFGLYDTDFGWGKPRKTEVGMLQSIGRRSMVCISESRDEEGGVEFGLGFASHDSVNSFNDIFMEGLPN
ncbi:hypothetical protein F3Y22_tig00000340pilonHSYRG00222 [Hibiscus syriacus]|uniref:HXXXD-type acyl-transferase family protein n=1 Tax=Hibiscus syriacus TaxID=106335 RepID=A0A6A3D5X1_HIBSY|nr:coumaroyl-CoA:anthocyanidin 3-O-glucoside-6''-O-coumaroyltransferase 1-like [Hibiscus syriacus]KAE8735328.1 hypothetical protein F3Y22_tig00000340pilonHSYRG00222 [Hibiscus syriacus]